MRSPPRLAARTGRGVPRPYTPIAGTGTLGTTPPRTMTTSTHHPRTFRVAVRRA